jgi:hypothetical protein
MKKAKKKQKKYTMQSWKKPFSKGLWTKIPKALQEQFWALPLEERVQLAPQFAAIATSLGLTDDGEAALALVSEDRDLVVEQATKLAAYVGARRLKTARLCDSIRELHLNRQLHGCGSSSAYLRNTDTRLGMSSSAFSFLASAGKGYRLFGDELRNGVDGEEGVDESFLAKSLAKLALYHKVRVARGPKEALHGFKVYSFAVFRRLEFTAEPFVTFTAEDAKAEEIAKAAQAEKAALLAGEPTKAKASSKRRRLPSLEEAGPKGPYELAIRRIIARGDQVHLLSTALPEALIDVESRLAHWRQSIDEGNRLHYRNGATPESEEAILASKVALDIEDYIRSINTGIAANRRTLAILVARLRDEPFFYPRWHNEHNSFAAYANQVLGIGEELRDLIRIGRNLIRFPSVLEGQTGFGTDVHFYSLRYIDRAMAKHGSDVALIRARIKSLTTREFAEFARDPYYDQRGSLRALPSKKEARVVELLCEVNNLLEQGRAVKVIEILTESERGYLADILSAAENTLQTKAVLASELSSVSEEMANNTAEAPTATAESPLTLTPIAQGEPAKEAQLDNAA